MWKIQVFYRDISQRPVVATEILRNLSIEGIPIPQTDVYDRLIGYLASAGYTQYDVSDLNGVPDPNKRTISGCDTTQVGADLFVFAYDWRNSNWTSARDLFEYVQCIKSIRGNPVDFKVHIIAHSMGGLVARRYILGNPGSHSVDRMVTLGTPWLGAPKFLNTLEFGGNLLDPTSPVILPPTIKTIAPFIRGAHELIPSKAYVDDLTLMNIPFDHPLGEDGWDDFDFDPTRTSEYDFNRLRATMNVRYANRPGDTTNTFHSQIGQDDWRGDTSGVGYYNFVGYGKNTIVSLVAKKTWLGQKYFEQVKLADGDGTVPLLSALRKGRQDYRGPIRLEKGFPLNHGELASDRSIFPFINCVVNIPDANACINNSSVGIRESDNTVSEEFPGDPHYLLKVIGSLSVIISDSFGNTTNPFSTSADEGVRTIQTDVTGDTYLSATFPLDQNYQVVLRSPVTPLSILLTKSDGLTITQAIRYVDVTLPANVLAFLEITPQGVTALRYDSDGNGTFDTPVDPTISVTGPPAQDVEPPVVTVTEIAQNGTSQIVLEATDAGTGVRRIMFSVNGTNYQPYIGPLTLNPFQVPVVYAFADDNVANRSGLVTYYPSLSGNQVDNSQFFVRQHYFDFLNREPDAAGLAFWSNEIASCGADTQCIEIKRINVSAAYFLSIEFQETGYLVYRMYKAAYGNLPGGAPVPVRFNEFLPDTQQIGLGVVVVTDGLGAGVGEQQECLCRRLRGTVAVYHCSSDDFDTSSIR